MADEVAARPGAGAPIPIETETSPMEARLVSELPHDAGWQFEPKWDGFRCLVFRDGETVDLRAKSGKPLGRYFPEVVETVRRLPLDGFVLDGELTIPVGDSLDFDALQMRLHPAESRIRRLSQETPAILILFDILVVPGGRATAALPLEQRRAELEALWAGLDDTSGLRLTPFTRSREEAEAWLGRLGGALDGVVAKRLDGPYESGERAMLKVKRMRSADCVVGGFRYESNGRQVGSLLLGLYDDEGLLNHVGFTSGIADSERRELTARLEGLVEAPGFSGRAPGGPSRWSTERSGDWQPLRPELVVEVRYDHVTGDRFRHGTRLLRWRPDKAPRQCGFDQLEAEARPAELIARMVAGT
ncbi:ATP-dependent DNA ligase [uncultured Enterovirga sp.]|uniref:ATP-dependent DNA ligase n=1 Tax=uncultured Enterovirga sp. TaxID=2026352 RepID=UPI0035CA85C9